MRIRIRRWEWFFYGAIAMGGFLEWWIGGLNYFPHLLVILFWLIIFRIFLYGIGQFWDLLTGRDVQKMGQELDERVASFLSETENNIEEFGKNFLNKKTITVKPIRPAGVVVSAQGSSSDPAGCGCYGPPQGNRMSQILGYMQHPKTISAWPFILTRYTLG